MTTIADVRQSIAQCVETTGLRCSAYITDQRNPPCAQVLRKEYDPRFVFSAAKTTYLFTVLVFAARAAEVVSAKQLDGYGEPDGVGSLTAAIQNSDNWDVTVDFAQVIQVGAETVMEIGGQQFLVVELDVEVVW